MLKIKVFNYQTGEIHEIALTPETRIQGQYTIGRASSCDLVLVGPEVSRVHSRIVFQRGEYYFTDLSSKGTSRINNEEVGKQSYVLKEDDVIRIGGFVLLIEAVETPLSSESATFGGGGDSDRQWTKGDFTVQCVGVIDETADVKTFCFVADPAVLFAYKPGQFVTLEVEINGEPVRGSYSISSTPSRAHSLEITVKRDLRPTDAPNGLSALVSNWLHDHISVGSSVNLIGGPMGEFTCVAKPSHKLLMISDGKGITPIMSMTRWVYDTSAQSDIVFFHSARRPQDIIFRRELELMAARFPNFRLAITTTQSQPSEAWLGLTGKLNEAMLLAIAPDFWERTVYVCGPDSFIQGVKAMLQSLAFPMQNYYEERLGAPLRPPNRVTPQEAPTVIRPPNRATPQEAPTVIRPPNRATPQEAPTVIRPPNRVTPQEAPTVIRPPNRVTPQEEPTVIRPSNRVTPQEAPTVIRPPNRVTPQEEPTEIRPPNRVTPEYEDSFGTAKKDKNAAKTVVNELPIPPDDLFPNGGSVAPKLVSTSPFSTGLPALYVIAFLSGISIGLFNPFISTLMAQNQVDDIWIGANSTEYFLAMALGTPVVAKILQPIGLRRTMMLGLALMGLSAPLFPLTTQLPLWFVIRAVMGFACCLYLVGGQTALNHFCHESNRAIVNGLHAMAFSFGFGIGPVIGSALYNLSPKLTFSLGSILVLSGIVVVWIGLPERLVVFQPSRTGIFKRLTLPLQGAFAFGFAESTLVSLYPVYLLRQHYSVEQIGYTFSVFVVGGLLATVPVTHLADRFGRLKILFICACIVVFSMLSLSLTDNPIATQIFAFIAGASISPVFPLTLTLIGEKLSRDELSSGSALFTAVYSSGCTAGPILSSIPLRFFGKHYIFSLIVVIFIIFMFYITKQNKKRIILPC